MIEIIFVYNNKEDNLGCKETKKLKEIFEEYAKEKNLDIKDIFLLYNGTKVNLETELFIEEQFNLLKIKTKKTLKFLVCKETPFQIIFMYPGKKFPLKVKLDEKMENVLKRYSSKARINLDNIHYQYQGELFSYEQIFDKTVNDMLDYDKANIDKVSKLMSITLFDIRTKTIESIEIEEDKPGINNNEENKDSDDMEDDSNEEILLKGSKINQVNDLLVNNPHTEKRF